MRKVFKNEKLNDFVYLLGYVHMWSMIGGLAYVAYYVFKETRAWRNYKKAKEYYAYKLSGI